MIDCKKMCMIMTDDIESFFAVEKALRFTLCEKRYREMIEYKYESMCTEGYFTEYYTIIKHPFRKREYLKFIAALIMIKAMILKNYHKILKLFVK